MESSGANLNIFPTLKRLFTELPTSCFGESLELGVLRIAEVNSIISLGGIIGCLVVLINGEAGVGVPLFGLLLMTVQLTCCLLLFIGVLNRRVVLMKPWFWLTVVVGCFFFVLSTLGIIATPFLKKRVQLDMVYNYVTVVIICAVMRYCAQAVYALMINFTTSSTDMTSNSDQESNKGSREYDLGMNLERD